MHRYVLTALALALSLAIAAPAMALFDSYQYITPQEVKEKIDTKAPMHLVDIQVEEEFNQHHLPGVIATYAYPVKSDAEKAKIDAIVPTLKADDEPIIVICPRGGGGAKRAYDRLKEQGINPDRLFILEKGQAGWPYPDYLQSN